MNIKKSYIRYLICFALLFVLLFSLFCVERIDNVLAGESDVIIEDSSTGTFSSGNWNKSGNCVFVDKSKIEFLSDENSFDKVTNVKTAKDIYSLFNDGNFSKIFDASIDFVINETTGKFAFLFGLSGLKSSFGSEGSSALWFAKKNNNLYYGLSFFETNNVETVIIPETEIGSYNGENINVVLSFIIDYSNLENPVNDLDVAINVKDVEKKHSDIFKCIGTGYLSFSEDAKTSITNVVVKKCIITSKQYVVAQTSSDKDTPAILNFDNGTYNQKEWYTEGRLGYFSDTSCSFSNGKFEMIDSASSLIGSKFEYSNFKIEFKVSDLQRKAVGLNGALANNYDSTKKMKDQYSKLVSSGFYVNFGQVDYRNIETDKPYIFFEPYYFNNGQDINASSKVDFTKKPDCTRLTIFDGEKYQFIKLDDNFWDESYGDIFINVSIIDKVINVKYSFDGNNYKTITGINNFKQVPFGYVKLSAIGYKANVGLRLDEEKIGYKLKQASLSFDDIKLYNLDKSSVKFDVEINNIILKNKDWNYIDKWDSNDLVR